MAPPADEPAVRSAEARLPHTTDLPVITASFAILRFVAFLLPPLLSLFVVVIVVATAQASARGAAGGGARGTPILEASSASSVR